MFIERTKFGQLRSIYLLPEDLDKIEIDNKETVIIPMKYDKNLFNKLLQKFPQGKIHEKEKFWFYKINN